MQVAHKKSNLHYMLTNTAFGIFIGFELALFIAFVFDVDFSDDFTKLYTFILAASISLLAAALTLIGVFASIENQQHIAQQIRKNKLAAARAFLPNSLSKLCEVCVYGMRYSINFDEYEANLSLTEFERVSINQLSLTDEIIHVIRDVIELSDRDDVSTRLSGLIREHQVFYARWKGEFNQAGVHVVRTDSDLRMRTASWAYLYAITASLFEYARNETEMIDSTVDESLISSAMNTAGIPALHSEEYSEEIGLFSRAFVRRF